ncbi:MAG: hypothetical protein KDE27_24105 [Planctomycetes bacterium]|nr:hypothetical protein [Planctomycetota bacterium]
MVMFETAALLFTLLPQEPASPEPVASRPTPDEDRYVEIVDVPVPDNIVLEVGGIVERARDDGRIELFLCTRRGEVWHAVDPLGAAPQWTLWAQGLQEPLGLIDHDGWLWCSQRGELSRMRDGDGDGRMDELRTHAQGWPLSGNYHEYCFGPALAPDGSFWLTLNKPFGGEPFGAADWRGWAIRVPPEGGSFEPRCAGLRSPAGVAVSPWGEVFYTDNQGEWCATSKLALLETGDFHGHPHGIESCKLPESRVEFPGEVESGLRMAEAAATIPNFRLPAVWIPYDELGRSPAGFVWDTEGVFPPFRGQIFCGDQYSSEVFRISLEKVEGRWQGACYPFRRGLSCGITRVLWSRTGGLWCGMTNRGWGSRGDRTQGLQLLRWRGPVPFELREVTRRDDGFHLEFTSKLSPASALPLAVAVKSWTYDHHSTYGCDPRDVREHAVTGVGLLADGRSLDLEVAGLEDVRVYELRCEGILSEDTGLPWHGVAWYTRNR